MSISVKRLERYIAARKKLRHLDRAWIHWINQGVEPEAELRTEDIASLLEQRAELLEALKVAKSRINDMLEGDDGQAWKEARKALPRIETTITKAEAAE